MNEDNKNNNEEQDIIENLTEEARKLTEKAKEVLGDELKDVQEAFEETISSINFEEKYKESLATMENLRKRLDQERQELLKYKASSFIQSILPTLDMFELAISANGASEEVKNWLIGFEMILKNFKTTLEAEGVVEINVNINDEFDGNIHHAIEQRENQEVKPGHIIEIKQKGYKLHDRLLRPAAVVVSKSETVEESQETEAED